jgi:uncharacterized protein YutE (UPF0331/DUF86 family)
MTPHQHASNAMDALDELWERLEFEGCATNLSLLRNAIQHIECVMDYAAKFDKSTPKVSQR